MIHPNRFDGRVAVVTGGAGAFGTAIAGQLAAEGAGVVVADLDLDAAGRVASELGSNAVACRLDVTQPYSVVEAMSVAEQQFGGLDVLVNNAGLTHRITPLDELPDDAGIPWGDKVVVASVAHASRHPDYWKRRLL